MAYEGVTVSQHNIRRAQRGYSWWLSYFAASKRADIDPEDINMSTWPDSGCHLIQLTTGEDWEEWREAHMTIADAQRLGFLHEHAEGRPYAGRSVEEDIVVEEEVTQLSAAFYHLLRHEPIPLRDSDGGEDPANSQTPGDFRTFMRETYPGGSMRSDYTYTDMQAAWNAGKESKHA